MSEARQRLAPLCYFHRQNSVDGESRTPSLLTLFHHGSINPYLTQSKTVMEVIDKLRSIC